MADRIIREEERPRDREVIREVDSRRNPLWAVLAVILIIVILWLIFGRFFGGGSSGTNVNVQPQTPSVNTSR